LDNLKETRGYWKLKQEAIDRNVDEFALEEAVNLSQDRLLNVNEWCNLMPSQEREYSVLFGEFLRHTYSSLLLLSSVFCHST
jgi:hypothetical protein